MSRPDQITIKDTPDDVTRALIGHVRLTLLAAIEQRGRASFGFSWDDHTSEVLLAMVRFGGLPWDRLDTYLIHEDHRRTLRQEALDVALAHVDLDPSHFYSLPAEHLPTAFDLLLLGVGPGGQVAGLVPGAPIPMGPPMVTTEAGLTLTPTAIEAARDLVVVALGPECSGDVSRALDGPVQPIALPIQHALRGSWFLDLDAAEHLAEAAPPDDEGVRTLAIDIGGSGIKMLILSEEGEALTERARVETPQPATPEDVLTAIAQLAEEQRPFARIAVGFPGVVIDGVTLNAPNLHPSWASVPLAERLEELLGAPARVANDADVQGMGVIGGAGVELVATLGTGFGSALFVDGTLVPNLELGHHAFEEGRTYEESLGQAALDEVGEEEWNGRLRRAIAQIQRVFNPATLYFGGGNARLVEGDLPDGVELAKNIAGLLGGIHLWADQGASSG